MSILAKTTRNEGTENQKYEIDFQVSDIYNNCTLKVSEAYRATTFLFHAVDVYSQDEFIPMLMDSLPITYSDPIEGDKISKAGVLQWVYRNCFSNLLAATTESLISAILLLRLMELAIESECQSMSKEFIDKKLDQLEVESRKLHVPTLVKKVEEGLKTQLLFKKQLLSINSVRNCITHDNSIVLRKSITENDSYHLELYYIDKVAQIESKNGWALLTKDLKQTPISTNSLNLEDIEKMVSFPLGSKVTLTPEIINAVAYTCNKFSNYLFSLFPIENIISPNSRS